MNQSSTLAQPLPTKHVLAHVADSNRHYPGEDVVFSTRLFIRPSSPGEPGAGESSDLAGYNLAISLPAGVELLSYDPIAGEALRNVVVNSVPADDSEKATLLITWQLASHIVPQSSDLPGEWIEFIARGRILHLDRFQRALMPFPDSEILLHSLAELRDPQGNIQTSQRASVSMHGQSRLMRSLPEIYHGNEFLGRFLMLFESFFRTTEGRIENSASYYDPRFTPERFLPWLGSWIGFEIDDNLPIDRRRQLLTSALSLYRRRGTRRALQEFLKVYTGGEVRIIEHRAHNLVLGEKARMGLTSALGKENRPHTFSVFIKVTQTNLDELLGMDTSTASLSAYQRKIEALIEAQKPAHTAFHLQIEIS